MIYEMISGDWMGCARPTPTNHLGLLYQQGMEFQLAEVICERAFSS